MTLLAQGVGLFDALDRTHRRTVARWLPPASRDTSPVILALDSKLVSRWGPPPWSSAQWRQLARRLRASGIEEATLITRPSLVLEPRLGVATDELEGPSDGSSPPSGDAAAASIRVPRFPIHAGSEGRAYVVDELVSERSPSPFRAWDRQLFLPTQEGTLWEIEASASLNRAHGKSAFCELAGSCPDGVEMQRPLLRGPSALISAAHWVDGDPPRLDPKKTILIGLTAPRFAPTLRVGPEGEQVAEADAVARAAVAQAAPPRHRLGPFFEMLFLVAWAIALVFGLYPLSRGDLRLVLAAGSLIAFAFGSLTYFFGWLLVPTSASVAIVLLPGLFVTTSVQTQARRFMSSVRRIVLAEGFRHAPSAALVRTDEELLKKLGLLTRTYFYTDDCGWFRWKGDDEKIAFHGGYGFEEDALHPSHARALAQALRGPPSGLLVEGFFRDDDLRARLVPLLLRGEPLGVWCIPYRVEAPGAEVVGRLVGWLSPRLALSAGADERSGGTFVDRIARDLNDLMRLLGTVADERRRQHQVLISLPTPVVVADMSGMVLYVNDALGNLLLTHQIGVVTSLRELFFRISDTEDEAKRANDRLFKQGEEVNQVFRVGGRTYHARFGPLLAEVEDATADPLGFDGIFVDVTVAEQFERARASIAAVLENRVRGKLMVARGYLDALGRPLKGDLEADLVRRIDTALGDIASVLEQIDLAAAPESEPNRPTPLHLIELLETTATEMEAQLASREQSFDLHAPDLCDHVKAPALEAQTALRTLFSLAHRYNPRGGTLRVHVEERIDDTCVRFWLQGAGFDETVLLGSGTGSEIERDLAEIRRAFPSFLVEGVPGEGTELSFSLPRA